MIWTQANRFDWLAHFNGDRHGARIRMLDERTFSVMRNGIYLGSETTLAAAQARAKFNRRSKINSTPIDWSVPLPPAAAKFLRRTR